VRGREGEGVGCEEGSSGEGGEGGDEGRGSLSGRRGRKGRRGRRRCQKLRRRTLVNAGSEKAKRARTHHNQHHRILQERDTPKAPWRPRDDLASSRRLHPRPNRPHTPAVHNECQGGPDASHQSPSAALKKGGDDEGKGEATDTGAGEDDA
jgi:site-specific DNA-cytosine methylase